jgi:hypothetical protein
MGNHSVQGLEDKLLEQDQEQIQLEIPLMGILVVVDRIHEPFQDYNLHLLNQHKDN